MRRYSQLLLPFENYQNQGDDLAVPQRYDFQTKQRGHEGPNLGSSKSKAPPMRVGVRPLLVSVQKLLEGGWRFEA
jgi:hypothetical protein